MLEKLTTKTTKKMKINLTDFNVVVFGCVKNVGGWLHGVNHFLNHLSTISSKISQMGNLYGLLCCIVTII